MNLIAFSFFFLACFTASTAGAADVPPERMRAIYEEVKTPYKYGIVVPAPEGKKVDCPTCPQAVGPQAQRRGLSFLLCGRQSRAGHRAGYLPPNEGA
jgi:hypothetical protein